MKTLAYLLFAVSLIAFVGCKKSEPTPSGAQIAGVTVDTPKLQQAFQGASPEIQSQVTQVSFGVRYGDYMKSLAALDKLANDPGVTEAQKKVVNEVLEQVKQVMAKQQTQPPAQ